MNIILLKGAFPLKNKMTLSKKWGIVLDNPKSKEEIEFVRNFLKSKVDYQKSKKLEEYFLVSNSKALLHQQYLEKSLKNLEKEYEKNQFFDKKFFARSHAGNYYDCLVKSQLIIRFDVRSAIAHGDFPAIKNITKKRKTKDENFDIFDLVEEVFDYVATIVQSYIQEPDFVDSLKKL